MFGISVGHPAARLEVAESSSHPVMDAGCPGKVHLQVFSHKHAFMIPIEVLSGYEHVSSNCLVYNDVQMSDLPK